MSFGSDQKSKVSFFQEQYREYLKNQSSQKQLNQVSNMYNSGLFNQSNSGLFSSQILNQNDQRKCYNLELENQRLQSELQVLRQRNLQYLQRIKTLEENALSLQSVIYQQTLALQQTTQQLLNTPQKNSASKKSAKKQIQNQAEKSSQQLQQNLSPQSIKNEGQTSPAQQELQPNQIQQNKLINQSAHSPATSGSNPAASNVFSSSYNSQNIISTLCQILCVQSENQLVEVASKYMQCIKILPKLEKFIDNIFEIIFPTTNEDKDKSQKMQMIIPTLENWSRVISQQYVIKQQCQESMQLKSDFTKAFGHLNIPLHDMLKQIVKQNQEYLDIIKHARQNYSIQQMVPDSQIGQIIIQKMQKYRMYHNFIHQFKKKTSISELGDLYSLFDRLLYN
ncbi:hypothetical protein ABPG74_005589 [Tetrahymena malaccensis]